MGSLTHIPRRRLFLHIGLYAVLFAALATSLPWLLFVPIAIVVATVHVLVEARGVTRRYQSVLDGIRSIHGESIGDISRIRPDEVDETIFKAFKEVATELERKNFQLVEKNIQLLSIKEIGLTLVSSLDEAKVVDAVINFLSKGLGYRELFIGIFQQDRHEINFYVFRDTAGGHLYEEHQVRLEDLDGLMRKSVQMHQSVLIRDPEMHPPGNVGGVELFADSTMNSYIIVPLLKSGATQDCDKKGDCILHMNQVEREATSIKENYRCPGCGRVPILGVLGVTDGFKAATLSKVDLVSVETMAVQLATMLENNRLFAELKQEESFRDNVINSMMNGLVTVDLDGVILFANDSARELSGHPAGVLRGMHIDDLIVDRKADEGGTPVMRTLIRGRTMLQQEAWLVKKDGHRDPILLNTSFLFDEVRRVQGVLAVFSDIGRIKRMEEQIMHLDKLAALGRFSSSIAHEIRNPLTGIAAGIQYLKRAGQVPDGQDENITFILDEVTRIDRLIGDLMNVVRISDLIYQHIEIESVIGSSISTMSELARQKDVSLVTEFPEVSPRVCIDADRITQVMINLVKNAIEASPRGSEVVIAVLFRQDVSDVVFDAVQDFVIIEVRDNGLGLTDEEKDRVFEPFFSKKPTGTGLGLYVTHSIIERHGGYIYVDSEYGAGTTFTVYLPVEQVQHGDSSEIGHPVSG